MATTTHKGPLRSGTIKEGSNVNVGYVVLSQSVTLTANGAAQVNGTVKVPVGSQILDILADTTTAWNGTTAPITAGTAAGGTQYSAALSGLTGGRQAAVFTAAQAAAAVTTAADAGDPHNSSIVFSAIPTGANTAGVTVCTVLYVQKPNVNEPV